MNDLRYIGAISFTIMADDDEGAAKMMREMVGAMRAVVPEDYSLRLGAVVARTRPDRLPGGPVDRLNSPPHVARDMIAEGALRAERGF